MNFVLWEKEIILLTVGSLETTLKHQCRNISNISSAVTVTGGVHTEKCLIFCFNGTHLSRFRAGDKKKQKTAVLFIRTKFKKSSEMQLNLKRL